MRIRKFNFYSAKVLQNLPKYVNYASFDGVNDYVECGAGVGNIGYSDFTIEYWLRVSTTTAFYCVNKSKAAASDRYFTGTSSGRPRAYINNASNNPVSLLSTTNVADGTWHHILNSFDRDGSVSIFVDGVFDTSASIAHLADVDYDETLPFRLGCYTSGSAPFGPVNFAPGHLRDVRMWSKVLTPEERLATMNTKYTTPQPGLIGNWPLYNNADDISGNNYHGTPMNGLLYDQDLL